MGRITRRCPIQATVAILALAALTGLRSVSPAAAHGLLISDIHLDLAPNENPKDHDDLDPNAPARSKLMQELRDAPLREWDGLLKGWPYQKIAYGADAPYALVAGAFEAAKGKGPYSVVVCTGDVIGHWNHNESGASSGALTGSDPLAVKTVCFALERLQEETQAPVVYALGNNDTYVDDYRALPYDPVFLGLANVLEILRTPEQKATFRYGGFYRAPDPTDRNRDFIVLNSDFLSSKVASDPQATDYGAVELDWLEAELTQASRAKRKASLVMHIPPGIDAYGSSGGSTVSTWREDYTARFVRLVQAYPDVVQAAFAGHVHMDDFRVMSDKAGKPFLPIRITPGVSPLFGNNPGFSTFTPGPGVPIGEVETFYLPVDAPNGVKPWDAHFAPTLGMGPFTAPILDGLAAKLRKDPAFRGNFVNDYYDRSTAQHYKDDRWPYYACAQTSFSRGDYDACVTSLKPSR